MRSLKVLPVIAVLMLAVPGCEDEPGTEADAQVTCEDFDVFLAECFPDCAMGVDCVTAFQDSELNVQVVLVDCSNCLSLNTATCMDCKVDGASCFEVINAHLGMDCVL